MTDDSKQLLPGLLVDREGIISRGQRPREIIPSRGDYLHYPPTSQAITVLLYRTFYSRRQNHKTRANLNVLTCCQLDSLPFVARLCFISVVTIATLLLSVCWHVRVCARLLAQRNTVALSHCVRTDVNCCALLCHGIREIIDWQLVIWGLFHESRIMG